MPASSHQTDQHKVVASEILGVAESEEDALSDEEEEHELNSFVPFSVTTFNETLEHTWSYFDSNDRFFACTSGKDKCIAFQCFRC
jgi:hypothetical protein